jgi:O-antigen/teichoic acid export membrane protein
MDSARALLIFSLPLMPAIAATWVGEFAHRAILLGASGATEVGYFGVAARFASIVGLVAAGFQLAWLPHAFSLGTGAAALRRIGFDAGRILVVLSAAVTLIAFVGPDLVPLVSGPTFAPAVPVVGVALVGTLATGCYLVASMPSALAARTRDLGVAGVVGVIVAVALNVVLAGPAGAFGTATAIAVGQIIGAVIAWRLGSRIVQLPLRKETLGVVVLSAVIAILCMVGQPSVTFGPRVALLAVFLIAGWREGTLRDVITYANRFRARTIRR